MIIFFTKNGNLHNFFFFFFFGGGGGGRNGRVSVARGYCG